MAAIKKTFSGLLDTPASKYLSGPSMAAEQTEAPAPQLANYSRPKPAPDKKDVKAQRFSLLLTARQREELNKLAIVKGSSINELIGQFINAGLETSADDLAKYDEIIEVMSR